MQVSFAEHEKRLRNLTERVYRRIWAAGARTVQKDDIFQELAIAWCQARDAWRPEHGVPFVPYMLRGAMHHINRWVDRELKQVKIAPFNLDEPTTLDKVNTDHELHEFIADKNAVNAVDLLLEREARNLAWRDLSARANQFIEFLSNPPPQIKQLLDGLRARADYARKRGVAACVAPRRITASMILDVMGADRTERSAIYQEINQWSANRDSVSTGVSQ